MISPIIPLWIIIPIIIIFLYFTFKNKNDMIPKIIIIVFIFVLNLRIMVPKNTNISSNQNNLDVLLVIDKTISMVGTDSKLKNRLQDVKNDCNYIIDTLPGSRFSVITLSNESKVYIPFIRDSSAVKDAIDILKVTQYEAAKGTSINSTYNDIKSQIKTSKSKKSRKLIIFFLSDGENNTKEKLKSFKRLGESVEDGLVLGYGTKTGSKMKVKIYKDYPEYVQKSDYSGDAITKLDEVNLNKLAKDLNVSYVHTTNSSAIKRKIRKIASKASYTTSNDKLYDSYTDIYYVFIIPILVILSIYLLRVNSKINGGRKLL